MSSLLSASDAATAAASTVASASNTSGTSTTSTTSSDQDTFLKLMVAQLKYQNPDQPVDGTQYLAETAQFTQVQKLDDLSTKLDTLVQDQQQATATGLLGRTVDYTVGGSEKSGVVTGVTTASSGATLRVGTDTVSLADVEAVTAPAAATAATPATTPTGSATKTGTTAAATAATTAATAASDPTAGTASTDATSTDATSTDATSTETAASDTAG